MAEDDEDEDGGKRKYVTLDELTLTRLEKLAEGKWFGKTVPRVIKTLIDNGLRDARDRGYLKPDD